MGPPQALDEKFPDGSFLPHGYGRIEATKQGL
jgi:hypothetical protein